MSAQSAKRPLQILIEGANLPGATFCEHQHVHVGVQCRSEAVDLVPGDARVAAFEFEVDVLSSPDGSWDFRGPYVHGKRGERFVYLTWGEVRDGTFSMFRRAKLMLDDVPDTAVRAVVARVDLTDECGMPRCARLMAPALEWS